MDIFTIVQWIAMATTVAGSWLVASHHKARRNAGFWIFLLSNVLWAGWGWHDHAYALVLLQILLAVTNIRGASKSEAKA
jgi:hypothetical protein